MISTTASLRSLKIAYTALMTALVTASTSLFTVYIPATKGFFNVGETMVYLSALLFGPYVGGFAGGVGSALADLILGYYYYAPATLIIKGCEGFIVGSLSRKAKKLQKLWRPIGLTMAIVLAAVIAIHMPLYYSGVANYTLGFAPEEGPIYAITFNIFIPTYLWWALSILTFILSSIAVFKVEPSLGWIILSLIVGGLVMVSGYLLYEIYLVGLPSALVEVPFNIGQMIIGIIVSVPVYHIIKNYQLVR